ncbi:cGMP-dependent protein kinase-like isoform X2 [Zophobas morio]|uniref:cGMP-dependent protein kinase-like isoform X2 n=1 Tax=Zophobas morio TaxID=2755281 RepID=UPI003083CB42
MGGLLSFPGPYIEEQCLNVLPFLAGLSKRQFKILLEACVQNQYKAGCLVVSEGDSPGFNIIVSGSVEVLSEKENFVSRLGAGSWFGVLDLTDKTPQKVSLVAVEDQTTILTIKRSHYEALKEKDPHVAAYLSPISDGSTLIKLKNVAFLQGLSETIIQQLFWLFQFRCCPSGTVVCKQNEVSDGFYLIVSGRCHVSVLDVNTNTSVFLCSLQSGEWFGEISLIEHTNRTADVVAFEDCLFLFLSPENFNKFIQVQERHIQGSCRAFDSLISKRTTSSLKAVSLFNFLVTKEIGPVRKFDEERLALLGCLFKFEKFEEDQVIFQQGDQSDAMFIIVSGSVSMSVQVGDEETRLLELRNGDFFGEMALFSDSPRPFKCAAKSDVVCLKLLRKNFQAFLQVSPSISENVEQIIRKRTGDFLLRIPFFSHIKENKPWSKLSLLGNLCQFEFFPSGSTVFREGQPGDKFYVIVTGQVKASVFVDGSDHILSELGPGDFFGEVALTCDTTRTATITCKEATVVLSLNKKNYAAFRSLAPELQPIIQRFVDARTVNTLKMLSLFKKVKENKPWSKMDILAKMFCYEQLHEGDVFLEKDTDKLFVKLSGSVAIIDSDDTEHDVSDGTPFGDPFMLSTFQSSVDDVSSEKEVEAAKGRKVIAKSEALVISLTRGQLEKFFKIAPELKQEILSTFRK